MNRIKILVIIFSILCVVGCDKEKTVIESDSFVSIMEKQGFQVFDDKENFSYAEHAYVSVADDLKIVFVEGKKKVDIEGIFVDQCNNVYRRALEGYKETSTSGKNWSTLKIVDGQNYYYVSLVDDTYLYIEGSIDRESKIERIIEEIKY